MKKILMIALTLAALALAGCASTNDQGVTVNKGWVSTAVTTLSATV